MARIADKHGLTNKYRPIGSGKRNVRRGRPRKYLFGPPSRKRKTYRSSTYKTSSYYGTTNYDNIDIDTSGCISAVLIPFFIVLLIMFSLISIFRCLIPVIIGAGLLFFVEEHCKKAWGLPTGRWSKPVSVGWTILTTFAMFIGLVLVLLVQIAELHAVVIFIFALVYAALSFLILRKKYTKAKATAPKLQNTDVESLLDLKNLFVDEEDEDDSNEDVICDDSTNVKELCAKLKKNLKVDMQFWNEMHLDFRCNLVTSYDSLQLNFEIRNDTGVPWYNGDGGIMIKANFYDANGNLVHIDDTYIEDEILIKNRFSDYFFFDCDDISDAVSIEIYAYQED